MIYTNDVHVELEHCVIRCSWHTEEDTTTSLWEDEYGGNTSLENVQNIHWTQSGNDSNDEVPTVMTI